MEGIASRVRRDQEGANTVLRFVVKEQDGTPAAVEMRGHEIRGLLDDGDRVLLVAGPQRAPADGIHRPMRVENLTTGSTVTAWRPSRLERAAKPLPTALLTAAISSGVTFCFAALFTAGERPTAARLAVMRAGAPTGSRSSPRRSWASWPCRSFCGLSGSRSTAGVDAKGDTESGRSRPVWSRALPSGFGPSR